MRIAPTQALGVEFRGSSRGQESKAATRLCFVNYVMSSCLLPAVPSLLDADV